MYLCYVMFFMNISVVFNSDVKIPFMSLWILKESVIWICFFVDYHFYMHQ